MGAPTRRVSLFDGSSAQSSTYTSDWHCVADYDTMSVSWNTDEANASRLTLSASNDDGFTAAIVNTSVVTGIISAGIYTVDPGMRWLRAQRQSNESLTVVNMQFNTR